MNRRQLLVATPLAFLPAISLAMPVADAPIDPVVALCREYHVHHAEANRLMDAIPPELDCNTPEVEAVNSLRAEVYRKLSRMVPTTLEGVAAMAGVLVAEDVTWIEESRFCPEDWLKTNMARGARAILGGAV